MYLLDLINRPCNGQINQTLMKSMLFLIALLALADASLQRKYCLSHSGGLTKDVLTKVHDAIRLKTEEKKELENKTIAKKRKSPRIEPHSSLIYEKDGYETDWDQGKSILDIPLTDSEDESRLSSDSEGSPLPLKKQIFYVKPSYSSGVINSDANSSLNADEDGQMHKENRMNSYKETINGQEAALRFLKSISLGNPTRIPKEGLESPKVKRTSDEHKKRAMMNPTRLLLESPNCHRMTSFDKILNERKKRK